VALAGQDLLQACLSIDPSTGELEPEGFGTAVKLRRDGNDKLPANENGGVEGALVRGARFEKLINERVARNDDERKLLAWLHQDPVCSKSLEAWFRAGELVQKQVEVNGEEEMACEVHRGEGEASSCFNDVFCLLDYMLDWVNSLMMLALTLAFVSHSEELRLVKEAGGADASLDARTLQNLNTPLTHQFTKSAVCTLWSKEFLWLRHDWVDGDTLAVTHLHVRAEKTVIRPCHLCHMVKHGGLVMFYPCRHGIC